MVWGRRVATAVAAFAAVAALVGVMAPAASAAIHVHCPGQDLQNKIGSATPGSTLLITGTCHGNFQVAQDLTLQGDPSATLDGDDTGSTLTITGTRIVHLIGLTITGGVAASGGGINRPSDGVLTLRRVTVDYNLGFGQSLASGGGIDSGTGSLKLTASKVIHNRAVAMNSGTTVAMGRATASGGGIAAQGKVTLVGSTIGSNRAAARSADAEAMVFGAGILMGDAPLEVSSSNFKRNSGYAKGKVGGSALGGGVFVNSLSSLSIEKSTFTGNSMTGTSSTGGASAFGAGRKVYEAAFAMADDKKAYIEVTADGA